MSFLNQSYRNDYIGTGFTTVYDYNYKIFAPEHLTVIQQDTAGVETTLQMFVHYTVQGTGRANGGTITLTSGALPGGYKLAIIRRLPITQPTDLRNLGGYYPETLEDQLDKMIMIDQQQQDQINHALKVPMSLQAPLLDLELPNPQGGYAIGWSQDETGLINIPVEVATELFLPKDGSSEMTGPLRLTGALGGMVTVDRTEGGGFGDWTWFAQDGTLHVQYSGVDFMTINSNGAFFTGLIFGRAGGIGLGRITCSSSAPPSDGQEGDIHFQF